MAAANDSPLVVVTGASGYIATHVVKQLQEGGYRVRGTVRSLQDENKVKHLQDLCPDAAHKLELVEADLTKPESWEAAVKDAEFVIHVASPFPAQSPKDENEVIQPAVDGTQSVLKACVSTKTVKRVVLTSSCAAISWGPSANADKVCTEEDWSDLEKLDAYAKSKTLAEKAAWDFVKELPDSDKIELAVVNPAYVMGPVLHGSQCTSMEVVKRLMERAMPVVPKLNFPVVDVRDVATAHIKAMVTPEAAGGRHICYAQNMWFKEMALILSNKFDSQGYNVPTMNCPYFALWMTSLFDKTIKMILPNVNKVYKFDNTRMKDVLGITPRETKETLTDMAYSMIEGGFIKKSKKYKGPNAGGDEEANKEDEKKEEEKEGDEEKPKENGEIKEDKGDDDLKKEDGEKEEENKEEEKKGDEIKEEEKTEEKKEENTEEKKEEKTEEAPAENK
ncbi:uncharacterized protein [Haliotis cracherodii]|uniref:uncharacterized protein isoform X2 n=1 Tax=Haliotis cracherodii TaxID=6455 RepID=UPI0039E848A9